MGKSQEVPIAIKKGIEDAKKNMFEVPMNEDRTLPHDIMGEFGAGCRLPPSPLPLVPVSSPVARFVLCSSLLASS